MTEGAKTFYRGFIRGMLEKNTPEIVFNDSPEYARVLISELLRQAKRTVSIYCRRLGVDVWGGDDVVSALRGAIARGVAIEAILQEQPEGGEGNPALNLLKGYGMPVSVLGNAPVKENFLIIDESAYRVETDTEARKGYASKNDVATLCAVFRKLKNMATPNLR